MIPNFERFDDTGFNFAQLSVDGTGTVLVADFGGGYRATAVVNLTVREWALTCDLLSDFDEHTVETGEYGVQTRARYFWAFYQRFLEAGLKPFWIRDPFEGRDYLVEFVDLKLTLDVMTMKIFSTGVLLRQRRVSGVESVGDSTDEVNPDAF